MEASGREQNYWPAFVDALSNVVLTLVFVLVVFVFALVMASNKVEKKAYEIRLAAKEQETELMKIDELKQELILTKAELEKLRKKLNVPEKKEDEITFDISTVEGLKAKGPAAVTVTATSEMISLTYPEATFALNNESLEKLDEVLSKNKPKSGAFEVILRATIGRESYSIAQRLAYYRIMSLRNHLKGLALGENVEVKGQIVRSTEQQDGRVEIVFRRK